MRFDREPRSPARYSTWRCILVPAALVLAMVIAAWRTPWIGAVAFLLLAAAYAMMTSRFDWIVAISGPLAVVGGLFLLSWRAGAPGHAAP